MSGIYKHLLNTILEARDIIWLKDYSAAIKNNGKTLVVTSEKDKYDLKKELKKIEDHLRVKKTNKLDDNQYEIELSDPTDKIELELILRGKA